MAIYTKTGDDGTTGLFGGKRVKKYDAQIEAYGSVDELTSFIGIVIAKLPPSPSRHQDYGRQARLRRARKKEKDRELLAHIQKDLYEMMGVLCLPAGRQVGGTVELKAIEKHIQLFEKKIDELDKKLPKLTRFILPQGTETSSWFHVLRTVCRRAERNVVRFFNGQSLRDREIIVQYLNRLSDLFFMMARWYGKGKEVVT